MATKKKEEELAAPEAQSGYDTSGLENRQQVEEAMAGAGYRPGQSVTNAANALKEWQDKRPEAYQSSYQDRINEVLDRLLARENFAYSIRRTRCTGSTPSSTPRTPTTPVPMPLHRRQP